MIVSRVLCDSFVSKSDGFLMRCDVCRISLVVKHTLAKRGTRDLI